MQEKEPYDEEYGKAYKEFVKRYGLFGEKLQTEEEIERKSETWKQNNDILWMRYRNLKKYRKNILTEDKEFGKV